MDCWASVYSGFPDAIRLDRETAFVSDEFRQNAKDTGINLQLSGIEAHNSIGKGERYHYPLRRIYETVEKEHPRLRGKSTLRLAIKAINDTMGPNGLIPSLLVFGTLPRFPGIEASHPNQRERFQALKTARAEMEAIVAETRIQKALRSKLPPATKYLILPGDLVRVFRERSGRWEGPFTVTKVSKKIISVTDGIKVREFNITAILPIAPRTGDQDLKHDMTTLQAFVRENGESLYPVEVLKKSDPRTRSDKCKNAINTEIEGLLSRGAFKYVRREDIPHDANILGGRFVLSIKQPNTEEELYKARFIVQGHKDKEKGFIIHISKTVRHKNIKILLTLAATYKLKVKGQDVKQAYIQAHDLARDVYVIPDQRFNLASNIVLKLLKPLYGLTESGDSWFDKFTSFLKGKLGLQSTATDLSFFYHTPEDSLQGLMGVYVDDSLSAGTDEFLTLTDKIAEEFESKPRESPPFQFAGVQIDNDPQGYVLEQHKYTEQIDKLKLDCSFEEFRTTRHRLACITQTRPEILAEVNILSQVTAETFEKKDVKAVNKLIKHVREHKQALKYVELDKETMRIVVYSDGSFATNKDGSSQVGYVIFMADKDNKANLVDYASNKSRRVVRSVIGAETFGLVDACDSAIVIQHELKQMLKKTLKIQILTDSETLFNVIVRNGPTKEKRLMIDGLAAREAYNSGIVDDIVWIRRKYNLGDSMTKLEIMPEFVKAIEANRIHYEIEQSVNRTVRSQSNEKKKGQDT